VKTGRPPKPSAVKELAGNPGKRPLNHKEPKPRVMVPPCPAWLTGAARAEYKRHAKMLAGYRMITEADRLALAALAHEFGKWREAQERVDRDGPVLYSDKGNPYQNPWQGIASTHFKNMVKLMTEFGLTPSSRSRIEAAPEETTEMTLAEKLFASVTND
jgi:P27 family predicted phage terminase small subunit